MPEVDGVYAEGLLQPVLVLDPVGSKRASVGSGLSGGSEAFPQVGSPAATLTRSPYSQSAPSSTWKG